jgi:hypothetical protein
MKILLHGQAFSGWLQLLVDVERQHRQAGGNQIDGRVNSPDLQRRQLGNANAAIGAATVEEVEEPLSRIGERRAWILQARPDFCELRFELR